MCFSLIGVASKSTQKAFAYPHIVSLLHLLPYLAMLVITVDKTVHNCIKLLIIFSTNSLHSDTLHPMNLSQQAENFLVNVIWISTLDVTKLFDVFSNRLLSLASGRQSRSKAVFFGESP